MLTFFKKLFRRKRAFVVTTSAPFAAGPSAGATPMPMPRVETASLQLASIISRFPDELKKLVVNPPPEDAMVALPLPTILKYLPTGSVRMSLASIVRQAPPGTFAPINMQEKRAVEVPLSEIFKRVSPAILRMRNDQRYTDLAVEGFDIFGDESNPRALAPRVVERPAGSSIMNPGLASGLRTLRMGESGMMPSPSRMIPRNPTPIPIAVAPPAPPPPPPAEPAPKLPPLPPLVIPVRDIASGWPEPIKTEVSLLNGAKVSLPAEDVNAGLTRGKVSFQWGQIREWLSPSPSEPTLADESTELSLPLRIVAPAFLKHTKAAEPVKPGKRKLSIDDTIPELFGGGPSAITAPSAPAERPPPSEPEITVQEPVAEAMPAPVVEAPTEPTEIPAESGSAVTENETASTEAVASNAEPVFKFADESTSAAAEAEPPAPAAAEPESEPQPESAVAAVAETQPAPPEAAPADAPEKAPETKTVAHPPAATLGQFFGEPEKTNWSPNEIVSNLVMHPDVEGAIVALHEGLVIAHHLPETMKGEVFAAFLPQIFARLNQYSSEMKLGAIADLELNASGRACHIFRLGQVYFGALATPGRTLPTSELRLCADALAQN